MAAARKSPLPAKGRSAAPALAAVAPSAVASMTGFAEARAQAEGVSLAVTLKSVNHRFLDLRWQAPVELEAALPQLEKRLREFIQRGHVSVRIACDAAAAAAGASLNQELLDAYLRAHAELSQRLHLREPPAVSELLRLPGLLGVRAAPPLPDSASALLAPTFDQALAQLRSMRRHEGAALAADLLRRLDHVAALAADIAAQRPQLEAALLERLRRRLAELLPAPTAPERLLQEAALLAERGDVSEELTRLDAHLAQFRALLAAGGEVGKKLDFLSQELHREVNTLLSKTTSASPAGLRIAQQGLELKAEVEKIREQVQNLE